MVKTKSTETPSKQLWDKIKNQYLDIFALPDQTIAKHVTREEKLETPDSDALYVVLKSAAVLPALEEALTKTRLPKGKRFDLSQMSKYTVIKVVDKE
jgi:hypothetical protein